MKKHHISVWRKHSPRLYSMLSWGSYLGFMHFSTKMQPETLKTTSEHVKTLLLDTYESLDPDVFIENQMHQQSGDQTVAQWGWLSTNWCIFKRVGAHLCVSKYTSCSASPHTQACASSCTEDLLIEHLISAEYKTLCCFGWTIYCNTPLPHCQFQTLSPPRSSHP